ncbi:MAG: TonB-dependent receptor [Candidatus Fermentibacteraceae bacterium]
MYLIITMAASLLVTDPGGNPIPGAWVGWDGQWHGLTDSYGLYEPTGDEPDRLTVHATGFRDWTGSSQADTAILQPFPVSSGGVILVAARGSSFRASVPSVVMLGTSELQDLARTGSRALSKLTPGIASREYGGAMPITSLSSRGADPGHSSWMIDGHPVGTARDGLPAGLSDPAVFGALEVGRGGSTAVGGGMAGFFNYRTEAAGSPWRRFAEADHRGGARVGYNGNIRAGRLGLSLKRSVGAEGSTAYAMTCLLSKSTWGILATGADGGTESPDWTLETDATRRQGQLEVWAGAGPVTLRAGAGGMAFKSTVPLVQSDRHTDFGADAEAAFTLGPLATRTGIQWRGLESSASGGHYRVTPWSAVGWENRTGSVWLRGGVTDGKSWWNARAAVQGSGMVIPWAAVSRDATVPTFNDLYWPSDIFARGNPDLLPQTSTGAEAGIRYITAGNTALSVTGFITDTKKLILWLPGEDGIWVPENTSESLSRGVELEASATAGPIRVGGNVTFATATDETPGTTREGMLIPYRPQITGGGHLTITMEKIEFELSLSGQGRRFTNRTETESLEPYLIMDAQAAFPLGATTIRAWVLNAAGTDYEESGGYRGRPRTFGITIGTGERR